jgi:predicted transposase YdaD
MLAEINKFTAEEYKQYKQSLENMGEFDNIIRTTEELAEQRGRELGRNEGLAEGQADTIRKMLAGGIPAEAIADALGITTEECESYRN